MRFNKLDLNLLVALDALLTEPNITRAAESMFMSQSAMSNALGRLRDYFEDDLLIQVGRKMELTPRAQVLREAVRDVLLRIDTSIAAKPHFDGLTSDREFTLCVSDFSMEILMPRVFALLEAQRSKVRFRLIPQVAGPGRMLERGDSDLLIVPKAYCSPDHPNEVLFTETFVCVVWSGSQLARRELTVDRYAEAGHIVMQPTLNELDSFEGWFMHRQGLDRRIEVKTYSFNSMASLVIGTERIATMHTRLAKLYERALPIKVYPVPLAMPAFEQAMQWHKYRSLDPGIIWLRDILMEASRGLLAETAAQATVPA